MFLSHAKKKYNKFIKRHFIWKYYTLPLLEKIGVVFLIIITIGLPINKLPFYILFLFSLIIIAQNKTRHSTKNWLIAIALILLINIVNNFILPTLKIEEGFNYFVYDNRFVYGKRNEVLEKNLPPKIFHFMKKELRKEYPKQGECEDIDYCWGDNIKYKGPKEVFALSGDAIWQNPKYSRIVDHISFHNQRELRMDILNSAEVNWLDLWPTQSVIPRNRMPYFVMYEFPKEAIGGELCWRGDLFREIKKDVIKSSGFISFLNFDFYQCMKLSPNIIGNRFFGVSISSQKRLSIYFTPNKNIGRCLLIKKIVKFIGVFLILSLLINIPFKRIDLLAPTIFLIIGVITIYYLIMAVDNRNAFIFTEYLTGTDGLVHNSCAREIIKNLVKGDIIEALRGNEAVFYFMPGMRYFIAIEKIFFGDTSYGLLLMLFTFILFLWKFIRYYLPLPIALLIFTVFFDTNQTINCWLGFASYFVSLILNGFPGVISYTFLLAGLFAIMTKFDKLKSFPWYGFWGALSLALAIFIRPNFALMILVFLSLLTIHLIKNRRYLDLIYICIGFSFVLLIPYHNWYFGDKFVPLTSSAFIEINYIVPISTYLEAFKELISFNTSSPAIIKILKHSSSWIQNQLNFIIFMFFILGILFKKTVKNLPLIRFLSLGLLVQHITLNIWHNGPRYSNIVWLLTFIVTLIMAYEFIKKNVFIYRKRKI